MATTFELMITFFSVFDWIQLDKEVAFLHRKTEDLEMFEEETDETEEILSSNSTRDRSKSNLPERQSHRASSIHSIHFVVDLEQHNSSPSILLSMSLLSLIHNIITSEEKYLIGTTFSQFNEKIMNFWTSHNDSSPYCVQNNIIIYEFVRKFILNAFCR